MIVMISASVLVFVGFWNSRPGGGWLDQRINVRKDALKFFEPGFDPQGPKMTLQEKERYARAKQFLDNANFDISNVDDKEQILDEVKELRKVRIEKIRLIQIPFFGAVFDMNDMGIFAGITFTIVLLWFRYSMSRELRCFRLAFKEARDQGQLRLCYDLLAMQQVMTVPPMYGQKLKKTWVLIAKALFFIPLLILAVQFRLNWVSRSYGYVLSEKLMNILLIVNGVSLIIAAILTWHCLAISLRADRLWKEVAREVDTQTTELSGNEPGRLLMG
ncbi:MAG TPA: hypothetical protein DC047_13585 [Blastocatellia bacterium]|nr:hypothetical protein [Blastocatellia bacterium]